MAGVDRIEGCAKKKPIAEVAPLSFGSRDTLSRSYAPGKGQSRQGAIIMTNLFKSILHNIGVVIVGFALAWLSTIIDSFLGFSTFASLPAKWVGSLVLALGFLLRVWATVHFYSHHMRVISLKPQGTLITSGPYRFSRNPLYLGGNVFIFFGAALFLGSPTALVATALHLPLMDGFIRREEERLERRFGEEWRSYRSRVRRWI